MQNVSINSIARELNVSASTVSRALKNSPQVNIYTRTKIQDFARQYNYVPNLDAIGLRGAPTMRLGVVMTEFNQQLLEAIEEAARQANYIIILYRLPTERECNEWVVRMKGNRVDGLIAWGCRKDTNYFNDEIRKLGRPFIILADAKSEDSALTARKSVEKILEVIGQEQDVIGKN